MFNKYSQGKPDVIVLITGILSLMQQRMFADLTFSVLLELDRFYFSLQTQCMRFSLTTPTPCSDWVGVGITVGMISLSVDYVRVSQPTPVSPEGQFGCIPVVQVGPGSPSPLESLEVMIGLDNITKTNLQHHRYTLQRLGQLPGVRCGVVGVTVTSVKDTAPPSWSGH